VALEVAIAVLAAQAQRAHSLDRLVDDLPHVDPIWSQRQAADSNAGRIEECLEHVGQPVGLFDNRCETALGRRRIVAIELALRHLSGRAHDRDGVAEVMRRHGHELVDFSGAWLLVHLTLPFAGHRHSLKAGALQVLGQGGGIQCETVCASPGAARAPRR